MKNIPRPGPKPAHLIDNVGAGWVWMWNCWRGCWQLGRIYY